MSIFLFTGNYKVIEITVEKVGNLTQPFTTAGKVYIRPGVCLLGPLKPSEIQEWSKHALQVRKFTESTC